MKKVTDYLQDIQDPDIKKRALKNLQVERSRDNANSLEHAIFIAFLWHRSPEKFEYWKAVHHNIKYPQDLMPLPKIK